MSEKKETSDKRESEAPINRASKKSWMRKAAAAATFLVSAFLILARKGSKS
jgi:hypothetical protein